MSCDVGEAELNLQPLRHFTYVVALSPTLPSLYLCHSSFSNSSVASPMSQLIVQPFFLFSYVTGSSLTSPGEPPMVRLKKFTLQRSFDYFKGLMSSAHSPTFPSLHVRHRSFSNLPVALPTSQLNLQTFRCLTYVTVHSQTLLSLLLRHKLFT